MQAKHPSGFNKIYTQYLNDCDGATYKISFFSWRVLREKMKIQVSSVYISSKMERRKYDKFIYVTPKKITQLLFLQALYDWKLTSLLSRDVSTSANASHSYNRNNYYIWPHLDAGWFFLYRGSSTSTGEVKMIFIHPPFF